MTKIKLSDIRHEKAGIGLGRTGEWRIVAHSHPHYEVLFITEGSQRFRYGEDWYEATAGDLVIYEPGMVHEEFSASPVFSQYCIRFSKADVRQCGLPFPELCSPIVAMGDRYQDVLTLLDNYCAEYQNPGSKNDILMQAYLMQFVVMLERQLHGDEVQRWTGESEDSITRIYQVLEKIHKSVGSHLDLNDLAASAKMSVSHFSRLFKDEFGESPKHYLIRQRMEKAKALLSESDMSGQEVARQLGYDNIYFFYRQFKQHTGMTTSVYRTSCTGQ